MFNAYQEHLDHEMGRQSEAMNCLAEARQYLSKENGEQKYEIDAALERGSWVVVDSSLWHCRSTDAVVGSLRSLVCECDRQCEAEDTARGLNGDYPWDTDTEITVLGPEMP